MPFGRPRSLSANNATAKPWRTGTAYALVGVGMWFAAGWLPLRLDAQRGGMFQGSADDPAIAYSTAPVDNVVDDLNRKLQDGLVRLTFEGRSGYLQSAIDALQLPLDSQLLLFSKIGRASCREKVYIS